MLMCYFVSCAAFVCRHFPMMQCAFWPLLSQPHGGARFVKRANCRDVTIWWPIHISHSFSAQPFNRMAFSEKRSESRSQLQCKNISILSWGSTVNPGGFKVIRFLYKTCEPFRSWKEGFAKLHVNLWEIWQKFKCCQNMSYPPWV